MPFPSPGDLPNSGIKPGSPAFQADSLLFEPPGKPRLFLKERKELCFMGTQCIQHMFKLSCFFKNILLSAHQFYLQY